MNRSDLVMDLKKSRLLYGQLDMTPLSARYSYGQRLAEIRGKGLLTVGYYLGFAFAVFTLLAGLITVVGQIANSQTDQISGSVFAMLGWWAVVALLYSAEYWMGYLPKKRKLGFAETNKLKLRVNSPVGLASRGKSEEIGKTYFGGVNESGLFFEIGHSKSYSEVIHDDHAQIGRYQYTTGSGKNSTTHYVIVTKIKLPRVLPQVVFDARSNNSLFGSNLPVRYDKVQKLNLESAVAKVYDVYAPNGYSVDVGSILAPDLLRQFIKYAPSSDIEIVDNILYVYNYASSFTLSGSVLKEIEPLRIQAKGLAEALVDNIYHYRDNSPSTNALALSHNSLAVPAIGSEGLRLAKKDYSIYALAGFMLVSIAFMTIVLVRAINGASSKPISTIAFALIPLNIITANNLRVRSKKK
jgi:hypothetical protein